MDNKFFFADPVIKKPAKIPGYKKEQWHPERMLNKEQYPLSHAMTEPFLQTIRELS